MSDVFSLRKICERLTMRRSQALSALSRESERLKEAERSLTHAQEALAVLQNCAEAVQRAASHRLSGVVSRCLEGVFGNGGYSFTIEFEKKRGRTEAELSFTKKGKKLSPLDAAGGGVVDVASMALRVACLLMSKPAARRLLVSDEPLKHLSKQYRPKAAELIETLAEELNVQVILVTHDPAFELGEVIEL